MIPAPLKGIFEFSALTGRTLWACVTPPFRWRDVIRHIDTMAVDSLFIICFCVCAAAMVTILEASFHMKLLIQNDSMVPGFAAMLILRELGAVVMALLVTSRTGAGMAAEVGTMQVTEQIDAIRMLGLDPIRFLVAPRFIASAIAGAILSLCANIVCLVAAMGVSMLKLGYTAGAFSSMARPFLSMQDLWFAIIKGTLFCAVIPLFSCFFGFRCRSGAEGVGMATTNAVVATSIAIIVLDFGLSFLFTSFY